MSELKRTSDRMWIVINIRHEEEGYFVLERVPTTKEEAEYYMGKNPNYEMVELKVVSRRRGNE